MQSQESKAQWHTISSHSIWNLLLAGHRSALLDEALRDCARHICNGYPASSFFVSDNYLKTCLGPLKLVGTRHSRWTVFLELSLCRALPLDIGSFHAGPFLPSSKHSAEEPIGT